MKRFNINAENRVAALADGETGAEGSTNFHTEEELRGAASNWTAARLVEIWNGLAGVDAVRKFKDRATAISRIWKQIQTLEPAATKPARKKRQASGTDAAASAEPVVTKKDQVLILLRSAEGATLNQIMAATGWQKHSVRGFLAGTVHKQMGLTILSSKSKEGERVYRLKQ